MHCCGHAERAAARSPSLRDVRRLRGDPVRRAGGGRGAVRRGAAPAPRAHLDRRAHPRRAPRRDLAVSPERRPRCAHARGRHRRRVPGRRARRADPRAQRSGVLAALRQPAARHLYQYHLERLAWMDEMVARHGMRRALDVADLEAAHAAGQPAIIVDIEGLDFLEGSWSGSRSRTGAASARCSSCTTRRTTSAIFRPGRCPQRAHPIRGRSHPSLQPPGRRGRRRPRHRRHRKQAVKVATKPLLLSHTALRGSKAQGPTPLTERQISRTTPAPSPRPAAPSASGTSSQAWSGTSTASRRWPTWWASIT